MTSKLILNGGSLEVDDSTFQVIRVSGGGDLQVGDGMNPTTVTVTTLDSFTGGQVDIESGATLDITQNLALLTGTVNIDAGGTLVLGGEADLAPGSHMVFTGPGATLELGADSDITGNPGEASITGFAADDTIQFDGTTTGDTYDPTTGLLTLTDGSTTVDSFTVTGPGVTSLSLVQNDNGTTSITLCYATGTQILTEAGERPIEDIRIGDAVITLTGTPKPVKWIGHRSYARVVEGIARAAAPVLVRAGALADNLPLRDLRVSPQHAFYLNGALIDVNLLINGVTILQEPMPETITYYNLEFEDHEVIYAEGAAAESFAQRDCRMIFDNADDFAARYPYEPVVVKPYAAPRPMSGAVVEAVRRRLDQRAGLIEPARGPYILGHIEHVAHHRISGWAHDPAAPTSPVTLCLTIDGVEQGDIVANGHRSDLAGIGLGTGHCGFAIDLPVKLRADMRHVIGLRRREDGAELPSSPCLLEGSLPLAEALPSLLASAIDAPDASHTIDQLIDHVSRLLQARSDLMGGRKGRRDRWGNLDSQLPGEFPALRHRSAPDTTGHTTGHTTGRTAGRTAGHTAGRDQDAA